MMYVWQAYASLISHLLTTLAVTDDSGASIDADKAFATWQSMTELLRNRQRSLFMIGNGASASMASHCAADLMKNANIRTCVFTDLSLITAFGNDLAYDKVFSAPLSKLCGQDDLCLAISSSGKSPNIIEGVCAARKNGAKVVTLSGFSPENPLRYMGNLNFYIDASSYGYVESCHASVLHYWMDMVVACYRETAL